MVHPQIIVHGGAGNIPEDLLEGHLRGCKRAAETGLRVLQEGGCAEDAVEAAIRLMEDDEVFDAGRGSFLDQDGQVSLDAAMMEGAGLNAGAVAGIRDIANPITLARRVLESEHVFLIGEGAARFAAQQGIERCAPERLVVPREVDVWRHALHARGMLEPGACSDTVGAVARDQNGHLCAGNSTGGTRFKAPGRVGDVPCIGAGLYADDSLGAASSTGQGEAITRIVMAKRAVDALLAGPHPFGVAQATIAHLWQRVQGRAGIIMLDARGRIGQAYSTAYMARAWSEEGKIIAMVDKM